MSNKLLAASNSLICLLVVSCFWIGCGKDNPASSANVTPAVTAQTTNQQLPQIPPNLLSKDPEYWTYRAPVLESPDPMSDEFLRVYSPRWVALNQGIESQIAQISDPELKRAQKAKLQAEADPSKFREEATKAYNAAEKEYHLKRAAFFSSHTDQWFEIAQFFNFSTNDQVVQFSKSAESPYSIELMSLKVDIPVMDKVFSKFRSELEQDIDSAARAKWQLMLSRVNPNEFYAGLPQSEIDDLVAKEKKKTWDQAEQDLRRSRLMLAGQGDVIHKKLTRLAFLNQMTGDVLYEFPSEVTKKVGSELP